MQRVRALLQSEFYLYSVWRTQHASRSDLSSTIYATMCLSHCTPLDVHMKWTMDIARPHNRRPQDHTAHNSLSWKQTNTIGELISLDADSHIRGPKRLVFKAVWNYLAHSLAKNSGSSKRRHQSWSPYFCDIYCQVYVRAKRLKQASQTFQPVTWVWDITIQGRFRKKEKSIYVTIVSYQNFHKGYQTEVMPKCFLLWN